MDNFKWTDELVKQLLIEGRPLGQTYEDNIKAFKESKQPKPLFKTEDGKDIYVNDIFWYIGDAWNICETQLLFKGDGCFKRLKTFSTKEAAEEYILNNTPCLSLKDVINAGKSPYTVAESFIFSNLKTLVQSKLKS